MAQNGKVVPNCAYGSNPYHECSEACLKKIKEGKPQKNQKRSGYPKSVANGELGKKTNEDRRRHSSCPKASNPYHECNDNCYRGISTTETGANKMVRRKKPEPPVIDSVPASKIGAIYFSDVSSPIAHYSEKNGAEITGDKNTSPKPVSREIHDQEIMVPAYHKDLPKDPAKQLGSPKHTNQEEEKNGSPKVFPITYADDRGGLTVSNGGSMDFSNEDSDEDEIASVASESRVSVGRYHVKESYAPILQSIFDKYGDIGQSCHLESVAMRSYYMECVCYVVQELQSSSVMELTKSKVKELMAILKDVESAQLRVAWLHSILEEVAENMEIINQHQEVEMAKANCDREVESLRKELESDLKVLAQREQEVTTIRTRIADARDRLKELEIQSSELDRSMLSIKSEVGKLDSKSLLDGLL
ncbi:uncharacterized protein LOC114734291 isoform X1 [Neltuma alba]|uniref:uncharacterized protein LOC114734291 isoform X1 n=1 Tax=Neltuma alba TaxID=207710 RepID=UPI0010A3BF9E|nr:uncharacterized protein LOC114734291 isoform X1 [Prosopis alba]XP_028777735.1 uncharacterized protein LOC114734291 isoform X1 [Prosopis alba]XP_028777745.1 uncharacterized protein LOC114734291 isoform X1 [Prosopis alba]